MAFLSGIETGTGRFENKFGGGPEGIQDGFKAISAASKANSRAGPGVVSE